MKKIISLSLSALLLLNFSFYTIFASENVSPVSLIDNIEASNLTKNNNYNKVDRDFGNVCENSKAYYLLEPESNTVISARNENERLEIASVTKIMTLLLVMEAMEAGKFNFDTKIAASENAQKQGGSQIFLEIGEEMTARDLIKSVCISSANDACVALAEFTYGNTDEFIKKMNEKAKSLGMENTHFSNCTGLPIENHYSSAKDIAIMARELTAHPDIFKFSTIWMDTVRSGTFGLNNTNKLLKEYKGTTGLKTGYTDKAKYCLCATATRNNMTLIGVVLGCETIKVRSGEMKKLLDTGFANFEVFKDFSKDNFKMNVIKGDSKEIYGQIDNKNQKGILLTKGQKDKIAVTTEMSDEISAPIKKGDVIGHLKLSLDKKEIKKLPIYAMKDVKKLTIKDYFIKNIISCLYGK